MRQVRGKRSGTSVGFRVAWLVTLAIIFGPVAVSGQESPAPRTYPTNDLEAFLWDWEVAKNWTREYIEKMPADKMGFKPVPEIRSFAEQMLHLASANFSYASRGSGAKNPYEGKDFLKMEELKTSKEVMRIVMESYDFAVRSIREGDKNHLDEIVILRQRQGISGPRRQFLRWGFEHQTHHRGQTTIYLRLNGIVPPPEPF